MTDWVYRCLIVSDNQVKFARELAETIAGLSGDNMWNTGLSSQGSSGASHWISAGLISPEFASILPFTDYSVLDEDDKPSFTEGKIDVTVSLALQAGMQVTSGQVKELFDSSLVTNADSREIMQSLGLVIVEPTNPVSLDFNIQQ